MKCTPSHCEHEPCRTCPAHRLVIHFMQLWTLILSFTLSTFVYYLFVNIDFIMHVVHFCILPLCEHWFYHAHYSLLYFTLLRTLIISCTPFTFVFHAVVTIDCIMLSWFTCIWRHGSLVSWTLMALCTPFKFYLTPFESIDCFLHIIHLCISCRCEGCVIV